MHPHLKKILESGSVTLADGTIAQLKDHIPIYEGLFLQTLVREIRPRVSLEIGLAHGISALFLLEVLQEVGAEKHLVIDPHENVDPWRGVGLFNIKQAKLDPLLEFHEEPSEIALPKLMGKGLRIDFAFVDGWHTFDHVLLDFFYINRMLNVGGLVVFDDSEWPAMRKLLGYICQYPAYEPYASTGALSEKVKRRLKRIWNKDSEYHYSLDEGSRGKLKGRAVALRKCSEDERSWNWFADF